MTEHERGAIIKYNNKDVMKAYYENAFMPKELLKFCVSDSKPRMGVMKELEPEMDNTTKSHNMGINPNDISFKNMIRECLNKINNNNYNNVLEELKGINFTNESQFTLLATELIIKSMNDVMASKNIDAKKTLLTPSEIYVNIVHEFRNYPVKHKDTIVKFKDIMSRECKECFERFIDKTQSMDTNNPHRVSNYKGFMNMIGLLYAKKIFPIFIVKKCLASIIPFVLDTKMAQDETDNYYCGYERLMNRVLCHYETEFIREDFNDIRKDVISHNDKINSACSDEYMIKHELKRKVLRIFSIALHMTNIKRFTKLEELADANN